MEPQKLTELFNKVFELYKEENNSEFKSFKNFLPKAIIKTCFLILETIEKETKNYNRYGFSINYYSKQFSEERFDIEISNEPVKTFVFKRDPGMCTASDLKNAVISNKITKTLNDFYKNHKINEFSIKDFFASETGKKLQYVIFIPSENILKIKKKEHLKKEKIINIRSSDQFKNEFTICNKNIDYYQKYYEYLTDSLKSGNLDQYNFSFYNSVTKKNMGNLVLTTIVELSDEKIELIYLISNFIITSIAEIDFTFSLRKAAIKSAIAAIMSRNMSHNLGSHVLSYAGNNLNHPFDMQVLTEYIQERMDFIAQITYQIPEWSMPMRFVGQLMKHLYKQRTLLQYIAQSEDLEVKQYFDTVESSAPDTDGNCGNNKGKLQIIVLDNKGNELIPNGNSYDFSKDPMVSVPGGITGAHAFYTIIENIIRNAAKHSYSNVTDKGCGMKLYIQIIDDSQDNENITIRVFDNVTKNEKNKENIPLIQNLRERINTPFIKETGELQKENWGLYEIKTGAGCLQQKEYYEIGESSHDDFIKMILLEETNNENNKSWTKVEDKNQENIFIGYEFKIPKPKEVLIICKKDECLEDIRSYLKENGIYVVNKENINETKFDYEFVLYPNDLDKATIKKLPPRNFEYTLIQKEKNPYKIQIGKNNVTISKNKIKKDATQFKKELYRLWINKLKILKKYKKKIELIVLPYGDVIDDTSISNEKLYKYAVESLLPEYKKDKDVYKIFKEFLDKNKPSIPGLYKNLIKIHKQSITDLINAKVSVSGFFKKYEENIESLPPVYRSKNQPITEDNDKEGDKGKKEENIYCFNGTKLITRVCKGKREKTIIKFVRHESNKDENTMYSEALSGSQSYFKEVEEFYKKNDISNDVEAQIFAYSLIETALLDITVVDERVYDFYHGNATVKQRFDNMNIHVYNKLEAINNESDILIVHQGLYVKEKIKSKGEQVKVKNQKIEYLFKYFFITSGSGDIKVKNIGKQLNARFIPFSNLRSALMQAYPEKYILIQTLMKI